MPSSATPEPLCEHCQESLQNRFSSAARRWEGVGPYYAMFPTAFADSVVLDHTQKGDLVFDPFAGRGTSLFAAAIHGRSALGIEINPVGWVYTKAKLAPASQDEVLERLREIGRGATRYKHEAAALPTFFQAGFSKEVRRFLMAARTELSWTRRKVDWTLMALLLVNLHGKKGGALSNRMRQTKAMSPDYAVAWWRNHRSRPPELDPVEFMEERIKWRYRHGVAEVAKSHVYLGDCLQVLPRLARDVDAQNSRRPRLVLTSPPYFGITNYHYDQWIRLWLLGGPPAPKSSGHANRGKFENLIRYKAMLLTAFTQTAAIANKRCVIYVRTYDRPLTLAATKTALVGAFPDHELHRRTRPYPNGTQSQLFGQKSKYSEVDLVLVPRS